MRASGALLAILFASSLFGQTGGASQPSFRAESNRVRDTDGTAGPFSFFVA